MDETKTDASLAERMAEFLGWERISEGPLETWKTKDGYKNPYVVLDYFFDMDGDPPNPRGFQSVLDMLDKKFDFPDVSSFKFKGNIVCSIAMFGKNGKRIEPIIEDQTGPTRAHALYSAVDELMQEIEK